REHLERLALVLLLGVPLRVAAQVDALPKVIERREVLLPLRIELAEHHALLELAHDGLADRRDLFVVLGLDALENELAQPALVEIAVLLERLRDIERQAELALDGLGQAFLAPNLPDALGGHILADDLVDDLGANAANGVGDVRGVHQLSALLVDDLALVVRDIVVLEELLTNIEVVRLDLTLRPLDLARQHLALDRLAGLHAGAGQEPLGALRIPEDPHQVVFHRQIEAARARVALTAGSAAKLVVDASGLVPLCADDVQTAFGEHLLVASLPLLLESLDLLFGRVLELRLLRAEVAAQHDVRAAARHVRRDG